MKKVLLCPPDYYQIEYEINPWMHLDQQVKHSGSVKEFTALKKAYQDLGMEILEISQKKGLPDMVYAANFGSPKGNIFIPANFKFDQRKGESKLATDYFQKLGFEIKEIPTEINFEGQGDLLTNGKKYFFGWGKRSDKAAKKYLEEFLNEEVVDFELINPYYYHLDTCFAPLNENAVAINPKSFKPEGLKKISEEFKNIIEVSEKDNDLIACNLVVVEKNIVIGQGISQDLKNKLNHFGFKTIEIPMAEFRKGGGSIKCLTLEFHP